MAVGARSQRGLAVCIVAVATVLWLAVGPQAAYGEGFVEPGQVGVESTEASTSAAGSPSGVAGLSLLAAAVVATLWNVAMGERRTRRTYP